MLITRRNKIMETNNNSIIVATPPKTKRSRILKNPQYRCSYCGEFGHNVRTCPKKKQDQAEGPVKATA
jgi:hypothetical protein